MGHGGGTFRGTAVFLRAEGAHTANIIEKIRKNNDLSGAHSDADRLPLV